MPTQFETLNHKLDKILGTLGDLRTIWSQVLEQLEVGDLDLSDEVSVDPGVGEVTSDLRTPRSRLTYKTLNGDTAVISTNQLEDKVVQVIAIAEARGDSWELYETEDGMIRLATSNEAVAAWNAQHAGPMR